MNDQVNRIAVAIERQRAALAAGVRVDTGAPLGDVDLVALERSQDNTLADHFAYQTLQAQAHAAGKISASEALTIYQALGEAPGLDGWAAGTDLATKVIVTSVMGALLGVR